MRRLTRAAAQGLAVGAARRYPLLLLALVGLALVGTAQIAQAESTFAVFSQKDATGDFGFISMPLASPFRTVAGGSAINFSYLPRAIPNLPADLTGNQNAHLTLSSAAVVGATEAGGFDLQPINIPQVPGSLTITRDMPAAEGRGTRTELLSVSFTGTLAGKIGATAGSFTASTPADFIRFTSDFLDFSNPTVQNFAISLTGLSEGFSIAGNGFLNTFTATGTGSFATDATVSLATVPAPASLILMGLGLASMLGYRAAGAGLRRRLRRTGPVGCPRGGSDRRDSICCTRGVTAT